uniref:Uncharacterized protein n=1 Tax=Arundo donax TaxID=35708 RepID=A0A0A9DUZ6_ARUDO
MSNSQLPSLLWKCLAQEQQDIGEEAFEQAHYPFLSPHSTMEDQFDLHAHLLQAQDLNH